MVSNKTKNIRLLVLAILSAMSQVAEATDPSATLFDFSQAAPGVQAGQAVAASNGIASPMGSVGVAYGYGLGYFSSLRVAGTLDWLRSISTATNSAPNLAGQKTRTQTCATQFRNPLTGALVYQTPVQSQVSGLYNTSVGFINTNCGIGYLYQAGNPRPLLVETVNITKYPFTTYVRENTVKIRVMSVAGVTGTIKWTGVFAPSLALGSPETGSLIDVNGDGTEELLIEYVKNVTPIGFAGTQTLRTRQVRNGLTNALINQVSWTETFTNP